jgi:hypothetical protein
MSFHRPPSSSSSHNAHSQALQVAIGDPVEGLYNTTPSAPVGEQAGLRQLYQFGLYSHCAYVDDKQGACSNSSVAKQWEPYNAVLSDMFQNYSDLTLGFVPNDQTFTNSHYLAEFSRAAYYMLLMGSICAAIAIPLCVTLLHVSTPADLSTTCIVALGKIRNHS